MKNEKMKNEEMKKEEMNMGDMNKESKVILFLLDSKGKDKEMLKDEWVNKYCLNESSEGINEKVIKRVFGEDYRYSEERGNEKKKVLIEELKKCNIDYGELIERKKEVLSKIKGGRLSNKLDLSFLVIRK